MSLARVMTNTARGTIALIATTMGWATGWIGTKIVLQTWTPMFCRGLAGVIAAMLLAGIARHRGESLRVPRSAWPRLALAALTNVFAWMGLAAISLLWLTVAEATLLVFTMPIWTTIVAWIVLGEQPSPRGFLALALGIAGIVVLVGPNVVSFDMSKLPGIAFAIASAILFATGAVLNGRPLPLPPLASIAWQVGLGCLPLLLLGIVIERPDVFALNLAGFWAMVYMVLGPMSLCFILWFAALRNLPPVAASMGTLLVPILGTLLAAIFLGEPFGTREAAAMVLTLSGVVLALSSPRKPSVT